MKTLLIGLLIASSTAHATLTCGDLFRAPPTLKQTIVQRVLKRPTVTSEQEALMENAARAFQYKFITERSQWQYVAKEIGSELNDPYKIGFDLNAAAARFGRTSRDELRSLFLILARRREDARIDGLDRWVRTETHALILYKVMSLRGLSMFGPELAALHERNVFFSDASMKDGTLLTFSFEKEGRGKEITMLYHPADTTEAAWFKEDDDVRYKTLMDRKLKQKVFLPASVLAPTSLKPDYLRGFSFDGYNEKRSWEVSHKGYEISLHRTMQEIREVSNLVGETHSFHVHAVFEMTENDPKFPRFMQWFKNMNDDLYLKGMEEGLHGEEFTGIANLPRDIVKGEKDLRVITAKRPRDVTYQNQKFFSAGLRGNIYGLASSSKRVKLGIELRDSTRNLKRLEDSMTALAHSLTEKVWEKLPADDTTDFARLSVNSPRARQALIDAGVQPMIASALVRAEPTIGIPFLPLEARPVFNFKTGQYEYASADYAARIKRSRATFVKAVMLLQDEMHGFMARGENIESVDIQMAIRQTLTEWARAARASERFSY